MTSSYAVVIERADDGGYGVWSPDLPGVVALSDTETEALDEMRKAIEFHLDGLREGCQSTSVPQRGSTWSARGAPAGGRTMLGLRGPAYP